MKNNNSGYSLIEVIIAILIIAIALIPMLSSIQSNKKYNSSYMLNHYADKMLFNTLLKESVEKDGVIDVDDIKDSRGLKYKLNYSTSVKDSLECIDASIRHPFVKTERNLKVCYYKAD